jgi:hypothetical protein
LGVGMTPTEVLDIKTTSGGSWLGNY